MIRSAVQSLIVVCLLVGAAPSGAAQVSAPDSLGESPALRYPAIGHPAPTRVMFQSLLLPGWGQISNRSWWKAALFLGVYSAWVQKGIELNQDKQDWVGKLATASDEEQSSIQAEIDRLTDSRNSKFWFAGLTAVLAMADAYVDAHLKRFDDRMDSDIAWAGDGVRVGLRWTFGGGPGR